MNLQITSAAHEKIIDSLVYEKNPHSCFRIAVAGGGCSGFQYLFSFDTPQEDDMEFDVDGLRVLIDPMSYQYVQGSTLDYVESLMSSQLVLNNPNVNATCGCGASFSMA